MLGWTYGPIGAIRQLCQRQRTFDPYRQRKVTPLRFYESVSGATVLLFPSASRSFMR